MEAERCLWLRQSRGLEREHEAARMAAEEEQAELEAQRSRLQAKQEQAVRDLHSQLERQEAAVAAGGLHQQLCTPRGDQLSARIGRLTSARSQLSLSGVRQPSTGLGGGPE